MHQTALWPEKSVLAVAWKLGVYRLSAAPKNIHAGNLTSHLTSRVPFLLVESHACMAVAFQLGIDDTSPTLTYNPSLENSTSPNSLFGWIPYWSGSSTSQTPGQLGNGTSLHITSLNGATLTITWLGTGIELYGNATRATYEAMLDGVAPSDGQTMSSGENLLVSFQNLPDIQHTVTLTAHTKSDPTSFVAFDRAVITAYGNALSANLSTQIVDDSTISYRGQWSFERDALTNTSFHVSNNTGDNAFLTFTGTAIVVSGRRDFSFGRYNVTLDGETSEFDAQSFWKEEAILFYKTGLDSEASHVLIITNMEQRSLAIGPINVTSISINSSSGQTSGYPKGTIAALTIGVAFGLALIGGIGFLIWRTRRRNRLLFIEPTIHSRQQADTAFATQKHDEDDDDKLLRSESSSSQLSINFAPNPALALQGQLRPVPHSVPHSPSAASLSLHNQKLHKTVQGSGLQTAEPVDLDSYLDIEMPQTSGPPSQVVRRYSVKPVGPRERSSQDGNRNSRAILEPPIPLQSLPEVHITSNTTEVGRNGLSFLDLNSTPPSSVRQPSRDSYQSQLVVASQPHSRSPSSLSYYSSNPSRNQKRASEQSRSSAPAGPMTLAIALQEPSQPEDLGTSHPFSGPNPHLALNTSRRYTHQQASPTDSVPMTVSDIQFREMSDSEQEISRRFSGLVPSYPGWHPPLPHTAPAIKETFAATSIVQKIFGSRPGHRRASSASVLQPRLAPDQ